MIHKSYNPVSLDCTFQQGENFEGNHCVSGLLSKDSEGNFVFEEVLSRTRDVRNAKLFEGQMLSMVRRKDGKLQIHMKTIDKVDDAQELATRIYDEVTTALAQIL